MCIYNYKYIYKDYKYIFHLNWRILFLFDYIFCCWQEMIKSYTWFTVPCSSRCWHDAARFMVYKSQLFSFFFCMISVTEELSVLLYQFSVHVFKSQCALLYRDIAWFKNEYAYQKYVSMYICVYSSIYTRE